MQNRVETGDDWKDLIKHFPKQDQQLVAKYVSKIIFNPKSIEAGIYELA
jgi:hypothetical protein